MDTQVCIYCQIQSADSLDHVPPQNCFPSPRPSNLITVPACQKCNQSFSQDDEYFRLALSMQDRAQTSPAVEKLADSSVRSLRRPQAKWFKKDFLSGVKDAPLYSQSGIYLGEVLTYDVKLTRLSRVVERIVRGLFYHHQNKPLPLNYKVQCYMDDHLRKMGKKTIQKLEEQIIFPMANIPPIIIHPEIFMYRHKFFIEDEFASCFALTFFRSQTFLCWSMAEQQIGYIEKCADEGRPLTEVERDYITGLKPTVNRDLKNYSK